MAALELELCWAAVQIFVTAAAAAVRQMMERPSADQQLASAEVQLAVGKVQLAAGM